MTDSIPAQRYGPTSGLGVGIVGLIFCAGVVAVAFIDSPTVGSVRVGFGAAALGVLAWAFLLRPRIVVEAGGETLVLRNPLITWRVPLAEVKVVGVRTVTTVKTDSERFDCVAVGYPLRKVVRGQTNRPNVSLDRSFGTFRSPLPPPPTKPAHQRLADQDEQKIMTDRVLAAADRARFLGLPGGPAMRAYAVPEMALLAVFGVALLVTLFL